MSNEEQLLLFRDLKWGDVPNWLLVVITFGAVIGAFKILSIERKRDAEQDMVRVRSQAALVSAWVGVEETEKNGPFGSAHIVYGIAFNGSNQPIYDVRIHWSHMGDYPFRTDEIGLIPPNDRWIDEIKPEEFRKILNLPDNSMIFKAADSQTIEKGSRLQIYFTDAENRRWSRSFEGELELEIAEVVERDGPSQRAKKRRSK